jgi:hypothetical protein
LAPRKENKFPDPQEDVMSRALEKKKEWRYTVRLFGTNRREQSEEIPENTNSGIGSEVDFLGNELLGQLHGNS